MKIRRIENLDIDDLIKFNQSIYPKRNMFDESIKFKLLHNPENKNLCHQSLIVTNEKEEIIGQILMMPSICRYNGKNLIVYWGMDYIVEDKYRGTAAGVLLCKKALKVDCHFGVGLSKTSLSMHKIFGEINIGYLYKYIRLTNLFSIINFILPKKNIKNNIEYPDKIKHKDNLFLRVIDPSEIVSNCGFWNENLLEFSRDVEFLKWRYFHYENKYLVYKLVLPKNIPNNSDQLTSFFVARPIIWKNVNCLLLVDYRISCDEHFTKILKATIILARTLKLSAIITGCSLKSQIPMLSKNLFFKFGKKMDIVSNYNKFYKGNSINKDKVFITFGDSDCDFYYGNNKW
ncbi:MAG: hypothetical protein V1773_13940 [bacterium]